MREMTVQHKSEIRRDHLLHATNLIVASKATRFWRPFGVFSASFKKPGSRLCEACVLFSPLEDLPSRCLPSFFLAGLRFLYQSRAIFSFSARTRSAIFNSQTPLHQILPALFFLTLILSTQPSPHPHSPAYPLPKSTGHYYI